MNGNGHITKFWFVYVLGGVLGFSYVIFQMFSLNVSAQITELKAQDIKQEERYETILNELREIQIEIARIQSKLGINQISGIINP